MKYTEEATIFDCDGQKLLGIVTIPETPSDTAVVIVVGGPQYRIGSHRQFVLMARTLASEGYAVLRFDTRGMGDSEGLARSFEAISADISAALDALQIALPCARRIVLWGLCDGASAALLYIHETRDPRVTGLCLANPWVRSETSLARTQVKHYYRQRVMQKEFWSKLLRGDIALKAIAGLAQNIQVVLRGEPKIRTNAQEHEQTSRATTPFQHRMADGWNRFPGRIVLLLSDDDYTAKEFLEYTRTNPAWQGCLGLDNLLRHDLVGADHTFSTPSSRKLAEEATLIWLASEREPLNADSCPSTVKPLLQEQPL